MREQTIAWLTAWGLGGAEYDVFLDIVLNAVTWRLKNLTGCEELPEGLVSLGAAMAAGEYLQARKAKGELEGFDLEMAIKSLQEGTPLSPSPSAKAAPPRSSGSTPSLTIC